jgi:hypothetical protein
MAKYIARGLESVASWAKATLARQVQANTKAAVKLNAPKRLFISDLFSCFE